MRQKTRALPAPTAAFSDKKAGILHQLALPEGDYSDASPKGSVDAGIRHLLDDINRAEGFVTTSSCAGRVSIFLEGTRRDAAPDEGRDQPQQPPAQKAGVGGKGAGGTWLYVSHEPVPRDAGNGRVDWLDAMGFNESAAGRNSSDRGEERKLIHFKFEPMILHVLTASTAHAQILLRAGLQAGFRESGAVSLTSSNDAQPATPMVAIRSLGLGFESLIGYEAADGMRCWFVTADVMETLRAIADERFSENVGRIERFRTAFLDATRAPDHESRRQWEDATARRERKRAEGLRKKAALANDAIDEHDPKYETGTEH